MSLRRKHLGPHGAFELRRVRFLEFETHVSRAIVGEGFSSGSQVFLPPLN